MAVIYSLSMYPPNPSTYQLTDLLLPPTRNLLTSTSRIELINSMRKVRSVLGETPIILEHDTSSIGASHITLMSPRLILNSNCPDSPVLFALPNGFSARNHLNNAPNAGMQTRELPDTRKRRRECCILGSSPSPVTSAELDRVQRPTKYKPTSTEKSSPRPRLVSPLPRYYLALSFIRVITYPMLRE